MGEQISRQELLDDLKQLIETHGKITRDFYREHGAFSERAISQYFPTFRDFLAAAMETDALWQLSVPKTKAGILNDLQENRILNLNTWDIASIVNTKYKNFFQLLAIKEEIEALKNDVKDFAPTPTPVLRDVVTSGNMLEIVIPDLHAGKLAWHEETGEIDWDTKAAEKAYFTALAKILARASVYHVERIVLVVGNDLLHSDNLDSKTTKGTLVNTDTRPQKTYRSVRRMLVAAIEYCRKYAPVDVKIVPGNHDTFSDFTLGDSLECWFHNYEDVTVDNSPMQQKVYKWGEVFLAWLHGHTGKKDDYGLWLATDYPKEFGNSKFREIHTGHLHKTKLDEKMGVRVRILSALCPADAWHSNNLFKGNLRQAEGYIWNKDEGLVSIVYHTEVD